MDIARSFIDRPRFAAASAATLAVTRTSPRGGWWVGPGLVVAMVGSAGAMLLGLALAGRDAERRRDLGVRHRDGS